MSLPIIRKEVLFSLAGKNISLTELRGSTYVGLRILSVEALEPTPNRLRKSRQILDLVSTDEQTHNTRVIVEVDTWKISDERLRNNQRFVKRICFYNRLKLEDIVPPDLQIPILSLTSTLAFFKAKGYDFTEDDLYIEDAKIYAKETSLGYYGNLAHNTYLRTPMLIDENSSFYILKDDSSRILLKEK